MRRHVAYYRLAGCVVDGKDVRSVPHAAMRAEPVKAA
jgi:hypothetical protein